MVDNNNLLGEKLKELRKAHSYTQDYVASVLGIVRQTYSNYETGRRKPDSDSLYKLAGLYDISIGDLMHLTVDVDPDMNYDAPSPSASTYEINEYLSYFNSPDNQRKLQPLTYLEKELLFFFSKLDKNDETELVEIAKLKSRRKK